MAGDYRIVVGYPWWLRPFLMRDVWAITLGRRVYIKAGLPEVSMERLLRHELAHVRQIERLGVLRFYRLYVLEFLRHWRAVRSVSRAYSMISFEIEAVAAEEDL
jgi:Domain of unknown function (DUF4157)